MVHRRRALATQAASTTSAHLHPANAASRDPAMFRGPVDLTPKVRGAGEGPTDRAVLPMVRQVAEIAAVPMVLRAAVWASPRRVAWGRCVECREWVVA
jgi:hypothetical protein